MTTKNKYPTVNIVEAQKRGYSPITKPYRADEHEMLDNVIRDMQGCDHLLVDSLEGISVYRRKGELDKITEISKG